MIMQQYTSEDQVLVEYVVHVVRESAASNH